MKTYNKVTSYTTDCPFLSTTPTNYFQNDFSPFLTPINLFEIIDSTSLTSWITIADAGVTYCCI